MTETDLLALLREAVETHGSQSKVAKKLGYSTTAISQALNGNYGGALDRLLKRVEEVFGTRAVLCPLFGEIRHTRCVEERRTPFSLASAWQTQIYKTCRKCEFNTDLNQD